MLRTQGIVFLRYLAPLLFINRTFSFIITFQFHYCQSKDIQYFFLAKLIKLTFCTSQLTKIVFDPITNQFLMNLSLCIHLIMHLTSCKCQLIHCRHRSSELQVWVFDPLTICLAKFKPTPFRHHKTIQPFDTQLILFLQPTNQTL